jgi:CRISPR/Cas system-associated protein Cas5 (RAMP superfamily)
MSEINTTNYAQALSEAVSSVFESQDKGTPYPVTYIRTNKHPKNPLKLSHVDVLHTKIPVVNKFNTPERAVYAVQNHETHKNLTKKGWKIHMYGKHSEIHSYYGTRVQKVDEKSVLKEAEIISLSSLKESLTKKKTMAKPGKDVIDVKPKLSIRINKGIVE